MNRRQVAVIFIVGAVSGLLVGASWRAGAAAAVKGDADEAHRMDMVDAFLRGAVTAFEASDEGYSSIEDLTWRVDQLDPAPRWWKEIRPLIYRNHPAEVTEQERKSR